MDEQRYPFNIVIFKLYIVQESSPSYIQEIFIMKICTDTQ